MRRKATTLKQLVEADKSCYAEYLLISNTKHFGVHKQYEICDLTNKVHKSDFYKITFFTGQATILIGEKRIEVNGNALIFYNPDLTYLYETLSINGTGYACLFDNQFVTQNLFSNLFRESPLFNTQINPIYSLSETQIGEVIYCFEKMMEEDKNNYQHKYELILNYLQLIIHTAKKIRAEEVIVNKPLGPAAHITSQFLELLEKEFSTLNDGMLTLKSAGDYANDIFIHVNGLNRAVKQITGNSTSEIIANRIAAEAKELLLYSTQTISQIAYLLGFQHPSNFNTFFKRHTSETPKAFRNKFSSSIFSNSTLLA